MQVGHWQSLVMERNGIHWYTDVNSVAKNKRPRTSRSLVFVEKEEQGTNVEIPHLDPAIV